LGKIDTSKSTDSDLHYYLETADNGSSGLYTIDEVSGKISKAVSGDVLAFSKEHMIIRDHFKIDISLSQT
jgi:hypothetical protein